MLMNAALFVGVYVGVVFIFFLIQITEKYQWGNVGEILKTVA